MITIIHAHLSQSLARELPRSGSNGLPTILSLDISATAPVLRKKAYILILGMTGLYNHCPKPPLPRLHLH